MQRMVRDLEASGLKIYLLADIPVPLSAKGLSANSNSTDPSPFMQQPSHLKKLCACPAVTSLDYVLVEMSKERLEERTVLGALGSSEQ